MSLIKELVSYHEVCILRGEKVILDNVSFNLHDAELIFILGASGSGKSSLLKSIYGELSLSGEYAKVLDYNMLDMKASQLPLLRRKLGLVFQDFKIFEKMTVFKNLDYFLRSINQADHASIIEILEKVGLAEMKDKKGYQLSGGEKQRLAIARALVHHPRLIIADEPTGNLNKDLGIEVFKLLRDLAIEQGTSILVATHDESLTKIFTAKVYHCENQRLTRSS